MNNKIRDLFTQPISKSIVASIGETIAFLVGNSFEERTTLEQRFKKLYGIRSSIAHGKGKEISDLDVMDAIDLAKSTVQAIMTRGEFKTAKTLQPIDTFIKKMRYSCALSDH